MQQLGLEGMPTRLFTCTPSKLTTWLDCPRRYRMTYVDRPPPQRGPAWAHNTVGAAAHLALARWWDLPEQRRTGPAARGLLESAWQTDGFSDDGQAHRWRGLRRRHGRALRRRAGPDRRAGRRRADGRVQDRDPRGQRPGRPDRPARRRGGDRRLQDRPVGADRGRRPRVAGTGALRDGRCSGPCAPPAPRSSCTTCRAARCCRGSTRPETLRAARRPGRADRRRGGHGTCRARRTRTRSRSGTSAVCGWCDFVRVCPEGMAASGGPKKPWAGLAEERPLEEPEAV